MDEKTEKNAFEQLSALEDAILGYLKQKDMTGLRRYFDDYYVKEFSRQGLQVTREKLWSAINCLIEKNRATSMKADFHGEIGIVITPNPARRQPAEETGKQNLRPNRTGIIGKLSQKAYSKIREENDSRQRRQLKDLISR